MQYTIKIDTDNAAFEDSPTALVRISLMDLNGNAVGVAEPVDYRP